MAGTHIKRNDDEEHYEDVKYEEALEEKKVVHKHPNPPTYYPSDDKYAIELEPDTYKPRDLLNLSVGSFFLRDDERLSLRQLNARKGFCHQYATNVQHFDRHVGDAQLATAQQACVNNLKRYIDEFFFFDQLRRRVDLTSGIDVVQAGSGGVTEADWDGHTQMRLGRCRLRINTGRDGRAFPLLDVVETLVHEMAHAYLMVFSADRQCDTCRRDRTNTIGVDGHGPVFLQLHRLMVTTVRGWHETLGQLAEDDLPGDTMVSVKARELGASAVAGLSRKEKLLYNRRVFSNKRYRIRQTAKGNVLVDLDWVARVLIAEERFEMNRQDDDDVDGLKAMMSRQTLNDKLDQQR